MSNYIPYKTMEAIYCPYPNPTKLSGTILRYGNIWAGDKSTSISQYNTRKPWLC